MGRSRDIADFLGKTEANNTTNSLLTSAADGAGVTVYATIDDLPLSGNSAGDLAFVDDTDRFYIFTGAGWYSVSLVNATPVISSILDSDGGSTPFTLSTEGASTVITITATDSDGIPLTFSSSADSDFSGLATLSQDSSVFTVTPFSEDSATTTSGTITFTASDGIQVATSAAQTFTLVFSNIVQNSAETVLLAKATGNSGTNSSFTDNSSSSHTITNVSDPVASSFSPYRSGGYSNYLGTAQSYIRTGTDSDFDIGGTGDWSYEAWIYVPTDHTFQSYTRGFGLGPYYSSVKSFGFQMSDGDNSGNMTAYWDFNTRHLISSVSFDKGQWNHICVSRTGTNIALFYNGLRIAHNGSYSTSISTGDTYAFLGHTGNGTEGFVGYITDARFINGSHPNDASEEALTVPTERLTAVANTKMLFGGLPYFFEESENPGLLFQLSGTVNKEPFTPYDYDAYNSSNHAGSAYFPSAGDRVEIPWSSDFEFGSGDFTIEFWYNLSDVEGLISWGEDASNRFDVTGVSNTQIRVLYNHSSYTDFDDRNGYAALPNVWQHFAVTRDGDTLRYFINGKLQATVAMATGAIMPTGNTSGLVIGRRDYGTGGGDNSIGYFSDVRLVKGTAVYTAAFTPPTAPLSAISGTSLLALRGDASIFDGAQIHEFTINGDAISSTTQSNNASSSMYFDGSGDSLSFNVSGTELQTIGQSGDPCTIEAWVYVVSAPSNWTAVYSLGTQGSTSGSNVISLEIKSDRTLRAVVNGAYSGQTNNIATTTTLSLNTWHHIALVSDGTIWTVFIDGNSEGTASGSYPSGTAHSTAYIGRVFYEATRTTEMYIEDLRITKGLSRYPFVPPEETLTAITNTSLLTAHADTIIDGSSNSHTITANGDAAVSNFAPFSGGKSVYFDGSGDYLSIPVDSSLELGSSDYTIECWFYMTSAPNNGDGLISMGQSGSTSEFASMEFSTTPQIRFFINQYSTSSPVVISPTINLNQWYHVAVTRSGSSHTMFINGASVSTQTASYTNTIGNVFYVGCGWYATNRDFPGYISNARLVKGTAVYTNSFTPPTSQLLG